jgi:hypothetical protein
MNPINDDRPADPIATRPRSTVARIGRPAALVAAGLIAGGVLTGALSAGAATVTGITNSSSSVTDADAHHGQALALTGTVTAVGTDTLTIKTSTGATTTYKVDTSSDIDKNGEAQLSNLVAGDAVRYSLGTGTTTIDKLHAGDEAKDLPPAPSSTGTGTTGSSGSA